MGSREVKLDARQFALISKALGDPKRFELLQKIGEAKEAPTCSCVREWLGLAPATVSHHLKELQSAGLVHLRRHGKFAYITLRRDVLKAYLDRLSALC
jgi:ArsR family transcriptional regulator, arsenate/arsenite/antimonite-responsive transcriptional repressor